MLNSQAFAAIGPRFVARGWVFFAPYRRGQGLSAAAGPYIGDQIEAARKSGGVQAGAAELVRLLATEHLSDQLAALAWLRAQRFVDPHRIAAAGNSFGGIETVLGVERADYCAGIDAAGGAESWSQAPALADLMTLAVKNARAPILFFQAANDADLSPTRVLSAAMREAGKPAKAIIYPAFGSSPKDGHAFGWRGSEVWFPDALAFLEASCGSAATGSSAARPDR